MEKKYAKDQPGGFSNRIERVAIIGATGQIGKHLTEQILLNGKHTLTAIIRPSSTGKAPEGANIVRIDYSGDDDTELVQALRGQQVLIITMAVAAPRDTIPKLIHAAAKAGVPYVLPNWYGHDAANDVLCDDSMLSPIRDSICSEVTSSGVSSYILLVSGFWYEFSLGGGPGRYGFDFKNRSLIKFDDGDVAIHTTTWPQCGRAVAKLLSLKELPEDEADQAPTLSQFRNNSVYISSFKISQQDMFDSVKRVTGTTDSDWSITHASTEQRWKEGHDAVAQGNWAEFTKMLYSRMFFRNGDADFKSSVHNGLLQLPAEELDEFTAIGVRMGENGEVQPH